LGTFGDTEFLLDNLYEFMVYAGADPWADLSFSVPVFSKCALIITAASESFLWRMRVQHIELLLGGKHFEHANLRLPVTGRKYLMVWERSTAFKGQKAGRMPRSSYD
jgi:hypothetical protein